MKHMENQEHVKELVTEEMKEFTELEKRILAGKETYQRIPVPEEMEQRIRRATEGSGKIHRFRIAAAVAAAAVVLVLLPNTGADVAYAMGNLPVVGRLFQAVTFRDYQFESDHYNADVEVPQIVVKDMAEERTESTTAETETAGKENDMAAAETEEKETETAEESQGLQETVEQVNFDIDQVTDRLIEEFKESAQMEEGYGTLEIHHETVTDNEKYFTLKLSVFQAAASGAQSYRFYTIDKQSGQQVQLRDLFQENSDYQEVMSEDIRNQMRALMAEDEMNMYWVDSEDMPELNWQGLREDQNFYFDADGNIVIVFDEYEVAPGYMGAQEFTVEKAVFEGLLKG